MAAKKKPAAKSPTPKRTDAAGRSGMGESAKSNVTSKTKGGFSSATKTGIGAFKKTMKATGSPSKSADAMYGSMENASKYAASKKKK